MIIEVVDLELFAGHGVLPEEKVLGQKFLVTLQGEIAETGRTVADDLAGTVSYAELAEVAASLFTETRWNLIETAADRLCVALLVEFPALTAMTVTVKKPWAPLKRSLRYAAVTAFRCREEACVALGGNLGDREETLKSAVAAFDALPEVDVLAVSPFYETAPVGYTEQDPFLNGALRLSTILTPRELLQECLRIEKQHGRERTRRWGPRTLDLDLLFFGDRVIDEPDLIVPHPRMNQRGFVLRPLADIAAGKRHPLSRRTVGQHLAMLEEETGP